MVANFTEAVEYTNAPLQKAKTSPANDCLGYDTKQSDGTIYQPLRSVRIWHKVNF